MIISEMMPELLAASIYGQRADLDADVSPDLLQIA
jgi:hypothetical protein